MFTLIGSWNTVIVLKSLNSCSSKSSAGTVYTCAKSRSSVTKYHVRTNACNYTTIVTHSQFQCSFCEYVTSRAVTTGLATPRTYRIQTASLRTHAVFSQLQRSPVYECGETESVPWYCSPCWWEHIDSYYTDRSIVIQSERYVDRRMDV
jgi:hypothetical protein